MNQKINKIIVLVGVILIIGFVIFLTNKTIENKNLFSFTLVLRGVDPERGVTKETISLDSIIIEVKQKEKGKEIAIDKKITDSEGKVNFKLARNKEYYFYLTPQTFLNYLYNYDQFPYKLNTKDITGDFGLTLKLTLKDEAKRDIQRRNDLLVLKEALEKFKEKKGYYPPAIEDNLRPESTTYQRLKPFLEEVNYLPFDPLPFRYYKYLSDERGSFYTLIAFPEIDTRPSLELLKNYNGQRVYLVQSGS
jgi:hypothetical protein